MSTQRAGSRGASAATAAPAVAVVALVALAAVGGPALQVTTGPVADLGVALVPVTDARPTPTPTATIPADAGQGGGDDALGSALGLVLVLPLAALVVAAAVGAVLVWRSRGRPARARSTPERGARPLRAGAGGGSAPAAAPLAAPTSSARERHVVGGERASVVRLWTELVTAAGGPPGTGGTPRAQERRLAARTGTPAARTAAAELRCLYEEAAFSATDLAPGRWQRALRCADVLDEEDAAPAGTGGTGAGAG